MRQDHSVLTQPHGGSRVLLQHTVLRFTALLVAMAMYSRVFCLAGHAVAITSACHRPFVQRVELQAEGNEAINDAKALSSDLGALVSIGLLNEGNEALVLEDMVWDGKSRSEHSDELILVWHRLEPAPLPAGGEGQLVLCLRERFKTETSIDLRFGGDRSVAIDVSPEPPEARFEGICFGDDLRRVWIYVAVPKGTERDALILFRNGTEATDACRWLTEYPVGGVHAGVLDMQEAVRPGAPQTFRLQGAGRPIVTCIRAFTNHAIFGTYGRADFERHAFNGLTGYNSFGTVDSTGLDRAADLGIRCAIMTGANPPTASHAHQGLYAYVLTDEPDCKDYGVKDRPMAKRIGAHAPQMLEYADSCHRADPAIPTMLTVNLTFTPYNYFFYGQVADIANPDCYPVSVGWSVRVVRNYLQTVRQATAPRPFCYTYQGCWEEFAQKQPGGYVSGNTLRQKGWEAFRDPDRTRGLGRPPDPAEVEIMMLYGLGCGAKGLFSYIDASELCGTLMFHGSEDLPELWHTIGETSRAFERVAPLIDIAQPLTHAAAEPDALWVSTLMAGDRGMLVVAVNEDVSCDREGFRIQPALEARFALPTLPWMDDWQVVRVGDGTWESVQHQASTDEMSWQDSVTAGAVYLVAHAQTLKLLADRDRNQRVKRACAIVAGRRERLRRTRDRRMLVRDLVRGPVETRLVGTPLNGYGVTDRNLWNPSEETYNGTEFWQREGTKPLGVIWQVDVSERLTNRPVRFVWQGRLYGGKVVLSVIDEAGNVVMRRDLAGVHGTEVREETLRFQQDGVHQVALKVTPVTPREHGGRIAKVAFLLP